MRVKRLSIYIRLCDQLGRPFERLKIRNPRQCGEHDHYCLRVAGKCEFFPEGDPARKDLNEALHRKSEREHELRIGVAAPLIPQRPAAQPGKTPVANAVQKYFDNLAAVGQDEKSIRTYRYAVDGFVQSYTVVGGSLSGGIPTSTVATPQLTCQVDAQSAAHSVQPNEA